jgi:hypothetical protein
VLVAVTAVSCISMRPLSPQTRFNGQRARDLRLVLPTPCDFRPGLSLMTDTLAAGDYNPMLEDDDGVYFQGSDKVFTRSLAGILSVRDGGIYLSRDHETTWVYFINNDGNMERYSLPEECKYRIEHCSDCEVAMSDR